ncbi:hypothetical protein [Roseobacter sp. OBYS 0001]|uniref:hypothetical protein n=1 Tax=Roseobacter sp. OBYS 0001 TaxID=882651 RepID=UPI001C80E9FA|nr:hypothetical protein [Roseobacter sp. OBYS 0001]
MLHWNRCGAIRYTVVSDVAARQVMKAQEIARYSGTTINILRLRCSLVKRSAKVALFPMATAQDITAAPFWLRGCGLSTGKYMNGGAGWLTADTRYAARYGQGWMHGVAA